MAEQRHTDPGSGITFIWDDGLLDGFTMQRGNRSITVPWDPIVFVMAKIRRGKINGRLDEMTPEQILGIDDFR